MSFEIFILLLVLGVAGGVLSGMIGIGGGLIFVPMFDALFKSHGIDGSELVKFTLANSFFCIFFSGIITSAKQYRQNNFYFKEILYTAIPAIVTGLVFTWLISRFTWYSESMFKGLFVMLLIYTVVRSFSRSAKEQPSELPFNRNKHLLIGLLTGIASSLSGLGGGVVMIPLYQTLFHMDMKKASSVSIGVIPVLILPMLIVYLSGSPAQISDELTLWGYLAPLYVLPISLGLWLGTSFGLKLAKKLSNQTLQYIFAGLLTVLIVKYFIEFLRWKNLL